jgi:hypothetical protein
MTFETVTRTLSVLAVATLLAGCSTAAQRQYQAIVTNTRSTLEDVRSCEMAIYNSPEYAPLRTHLPSDAVYPSLEQLSDESMANNDEIKLILATHPQSQACKHQALDRIAQAAPTIVPILLGLITKGEDNLMDLVQQKQSWGAYVRRRRDEAVAGTAELQAEGQRISANLQRSHDAELLQRQRAAEAAMRWSQTQQLINAMNRPQAPLNCYATGADAGVVATCR